MGVPTPHNEAKKGDIAKTVIMPGDPLRAKYIAEKYFEKAKCVNQVRNMFAYTGKYKGNEVTIMGAGMGMPSMGIYSYELYHFYDVDAIIRIGSAGAMQENMELGDVVLAMGASTDSNYMHQYQLPGVFAPIADAELMLNVIAIAKEKETPIHVGNILTSDVFYNADTNVNETWGKMGILAVDMESAALYANAAYAGKKALSILTISDHLIKKEYMTSEERQIGFGRMIELILDSIQESSGRTR